MIPYGGGTSIEAHFTAPFGGICVDLSGMSRIISFHEDDMDVVVQSGLHWTELNEKIKKSGLFFPVDPGPSASIGGMIATSCSGTNAVRYGTMKDWIINVTAVLADGRVIKTRRRPRKSSAGYNLTSLFVGSEGTLGFVTEAALKLVVIPEQTSVAVARFKNVGDAAAAAIKVLRAGVAIGAMELMDDAHMKNVNRCNPKQEVWEEVPTIFFKFGGTKAIVAEDISRVDSLTRPLRVGDFRFAGSPEEAARLWAIRKNALPNILTLRDEQHDMFSTDIAVPISRLPDIIVHSRQACEKSGLYSCCVGHVSIPLTALSS